MNIKDNERVKGCLYEVYFGWFLIVIVKYFFCVLVVRKVLY